MTQLLVQPEDFQRLWAINPVAQEQLYRIVAERHAQTAEDRVHELEEQLKARDAGTSHTGE